MIEKMIEELRSTSKRTEKTNILKKYFSLDQEIPKLLARCYDPFERFNVVTVKPTAVGKKNLSECYDKFNNILTQISTRSVTGNMAKELVIRFINTLNSESQSIVIQILNKDIKAGIGPETINAAFPNLIQQFSIQLANKYNQDKKYDTGGLNFWFGSRKYDGIRCIYQEKKPGVLLSRDGIELIGFDHVLSDVETLVERLKEDHLFKDVDHKDIFVDGELMSDTLDFNKIQGIVMASKNFSKSDKRQIHLKVFAVGPISQTTNMVSLFKDESIFKGLPNIKPIKYFRVENDPKIIMNKTRELISEGFEGLMLRHPVICYDWKRSNNLIKSKVNDETEAELIIIDYKPGKPGSKYENTLGGFTCKGTVIDPMFTDSKPKLGEYEVTCDVGSGFSDEERAEIWKNPDSYIGKEIRITYQCMSQNSNDGKYSLRFGVKKKGFKLDRTHRV